MNRGFLLVNDGNSAVQIIGSELRWNGDSLVPAVKIRIERTGAVLWVESSKVERLKNG